LGALTTVKESEKETVKFGKYTDLSRIWSSDSLTRKSSELLKPGDGTVTITEGA